MELKLKPHPKSEPVAQVTEQIDVEAVLALYEKFHNIEEVDSMAALAYERDRYQ